jgi:hypothetical protein
MKLKIEHGQDFNLYFDRLMKDPAHRHAYYASHAWNVRKQAVAARCNGKCERCQHGKFQILHHLTYQHFGREYMNELQSLCRDCHGYLHGKSDYDPVNYPDHWKQMSLFD